MSRALAPLRLTDSLWKPIAAWIRTVNSRRTLADMPDHLLKDIGLRRDQIDSVGEVTVVRDEAAPATAFPRPSAEVVAMTPGRPSVNPPKPEKPMAA